MTFMIKINNFLRGLLIASLLICFGISISIAQPNQNNYDNYLSVEIRPSFYQPIQINQTNGKRHLKSTITIGGSAGLKFTKKINKKISASLGVYIEEIPHNWKFNFEDSVSNYFNLLINQSINLGSNVPPYIDGKYGDRLKQITYDQLSYNIEVSIQLLLKQIKSNFIFLELSPKAMYLNNSIFNYSSSVVFFTEFGDITNVDVDLFKLSLNHTSKNGKDYRWIPGIAASIGTTRFVSKNMLQVKFFLNYVPKLISTGSYNFLELKEANNGILKHRINNAGFSISFGLPTQKGQ